jgi:hypothetical protein
MLRHATAAVVSSTTIAIVSQSLLRWSCSQVSQYTTKCLLLLEFTVLQPTQVRLTGRELLYMAFDATTDKSCSMRHQ